MSRALTGIDLRRPVTAVVVLYLAALLLWQRDWLLSGEMYAEMATNYFANARSGDPMTMLFSLDSGYWPLPQRLFADAVFLVGINAATAPYAYMAFAAVGSGLLAGSIAHRLFRPLVRCDLSRVAIALILLCSMDVETRGFINFTYLVVVFQAAMVALAFARPRLAPPWWCWLLPMLAVSKPHVLVLVPAAVMAAAAARGRMRWLMVATVMACLSQAAVLARSAGQASAAGFNAPGLPLATKLRDVVFYSFGLAGGDVAGPSSFQAGHEWSLLLTGAALCALAAAVGWRARGRVDADGAWLMLVGLALAVGTGVFNALTITTLWGADLAQLSAAGIYRHRVTALAGALLFVAGACAVLSAWLVAAIPKMGARPSMGVPFGLLLVWLWATGSGSYPTLIGEAVTYPLSGVGQWQLMARKIDRPGQVACVPIDPLGWWFQQRCGLLAPVPAPTGAVPLGAGITVLAPERVALAHLLALGVSVRPLVATVHAVRLRAVVEHAGGSAVFEGQAALLPDGVQVLLMGEDLEGVTGVRSIRLESDTPVLLLERAGEAGTMPTVAWMGQ